EDIEIRGHRHLVRCSDRRIQVIAAVIDGERTPLGSVLACHTNGRALGFSRNSEFSIKRNSVATRGTAVQTPVAARVRVAKAGRLNCSHVVVGAHFSSTRGNVLDYVRGTFGSFDRSIKERILVH